MTSRPDSDRAHEVSGKVWFGETVDRRQAHAVVAADSTGPGGVTIWYT